MASLDGTLWPLAMARKEAIPLDAPPATLTAAFLAMDPKTSAGVDLEDFHVAGVFGVMGSRGESICCFVSAGVRSWLES